MADNFARLRKPGYGGYAGLNELRVKECTGRGKESAQRLVEGVALERATAESVKATGEAYRLTSDTVELIVRLVGKDDPLAHRLRNLRDELKNETARGPRST